MPWGDLSESPMDWNRRQTRTCKYTWNKQGLLSFWPILAQRWFCQWNKEIQSSNHCNNPSSSSCQGSTQCVLIIIQGVLSCTPETVIGKGSLSFDLIPINDNSSAAEVIVRRATRKALFTLAWIFFAARKNFSQISHKCEHTWWFLAKHKSNPILFGVQSRSGKVGFPAGLDILVVRKMPASVNWAQ